VVMGGHMLRPKLMASGSAAAHAHSLQVEDVNLDEVDECQLWKSGLVLSQLCSAMFHQSPSFISLVDSYCDTTDITYNNYSSDNRQ